jgi:uncharacterized repeat protein (TIGR03803 family)
MKALPFVLRRLLQSTVFSAAALTLHPGMAQAASVTLTPLASLPAYFIGLAPLVQDTDGTFYGAVVSSMYGPPPEVYALSPDNVLSTVFAFPPDNYYILGNSPASVVIGADDALYGVSGSGGANQGGNIFRLTRDGSFSVLYSFGFDGTGPSMPAGLVAGSDGAFYGFTSDYFAGSTTVLFRITTDGQYSVVHTFSPTSHGRNADGAGPCSLRAGTDGFLYGATHAGGRYGQGTLFRLATDGSLTTLHHFTPTEKRAGETAALMQTPDGRLYGAVQHSPAGTLFQLTRSRQIKVVHTFSALSQGNPGTNADGAGPSVPTLGVDGNLYGTTNSGGANGYGTIYELTPGGALTTLHDFDYHLGDPDGFMLGQDGALYGTAQWPGGTIYKATVVN